MNELNQANVSGISNALVKGMSVWFGETLLAALPWIFVFGVVGLFAALIVMRIVSKNRLLHRKYPTWNAVAKLSYLVIFLTFVLSSCAGGGVYGTQRHINHKLETEFRPAAETYLMAIVAGEFGFYLKEHGPNAKATVKEFVQSMVSKLYYMPSSNGFWERSKADGINWLLNDIGTATLTPPIEWAVDYASEKTGTLLNRDQQVALIAVAMVADMDFSKSDVVITHVVKRAIDSAHAWVDQYASFYYWIITFIFFSAMFIVAAEIMIYRWIDTRTGSRTQHSPA